MIIYKKPYENWKCLICSTNNDNEPIISVDILGSNEQLWIHVGCLQLQYIYVHEVNSGNGKFIIAMIL